MRPSKLFSAFLMATIVSLEQLSPLIRTKKNSIKRLPLCMRWIAMLIGKKVSTNTEYFGQLCNRSSKEAANYFSVFFSAYRLLTYYLVIYSLAKAYVRPSKEI